MPPSAVQVAVEGALSDLATSIPAARQTAVTAAQSGVAADFASAVDTLGVLRTRQINLLHILREIRYGVGTP